MGFVSLFRKHARKDKPPALTQPVPSSNPSGALQISGALLHYGSQHYSPQLAGRIVTSGILTWNPGMIIAVENTNVPKFNRAAQYAAPAVEPTCQKRAIVLLKHERDGSK